mmetsp:Transcript_202/g.469  ORF Transcript_202/g.469 Transcript_202/m.469 type:complete len:117 (+) Transcript_202:1232-1582(+)
MYFRAADLEAYSADEPLWKEAFQAAAEATSLEKPAVDPTDLPVVEGSDMVDIHCRVVVVRDVEVVMISLLFRREKSVISGVHLRCWDEETAVKAAVGDANDAAARMAAAVENFILK